MDNQQFDEIELDRERVHRHRLKAFHPLAWSQIQPGEYKHNWHFDVIHERLQALYDREIRKAIINVPPGSGKTLTASVMYPTWCWIEDPTESFLFASFDQTLMDNAARDMRTIIQSEWFQLRWPHVKLTGVKEGGTSAREFRNTARGWRFSTSVGGKGTGRHPHQRCIDDPTKPKDTEGDSETTRKVLEGTKLWYNSTISTRQADPLTTIDLLIMQRLHDADLAGQLQAEWKGEVEVVMLPMRYEPERAYSFDRRTVEGELLWPERFPEHIVIEMENRLAHNADAQLQQNPVSKAGGVFKEEWLTKYWSPGGTIPGTIPLPPIGTDLLSWDCSFKGEATSDPSCGGALRRAGGHFFLLDVEWGRWEFPQLIDHVELLIARWPRVIHKLVEGKANGPAVISTLQEKFPGFEEIDPQGGKEARANAVAPLFKTGLFHLPHPSIYDWVEPLKRELVRFPRGAHDDGVDMITQGLLQLYLKGSRLVELMAAAQTDIQIRKAMGLR